MPLKVAITEDHPLITESLRQVLQATPGIELCGIYTNGREALAGIQAEVPDVLVLDLQLPDMSGKELAPALLKQHPGLRILILSSLEHPGHVKKMMESGCMGYLLKSTTGSEALILAIRTVAEGALYLDPALRENMLYGMLKSKRQAGGTGYPLTMREKEILRLIVDEYSNQEIADRLFLSLRTVEAHRYNLLQKLNVKNTAGLVKLALQSGLAD